SASRNTSSFLVGFIPTTQVFLDTPNLNAFCPRPSAFLCKESQPKIDIRLSITTFPTVSS
ncbi:MAG TPA: hypothetical protein V6D48_13860, partial [Oculatellaceae cyanobacterium]